MISTKKVMFFLIAVFFLAINANSNVLNTSTAWVIPQGNSLSLAATQIGCKNYPSTNDINITVRLMPANSLDNNADVNATITKPDNSAQTVNLSSAGSGVYTYSYNFDSNGTYRISFSANDSGNNAVGTASLFAYVGNFDLNISFLNNNPSYSSGNTGTIRNYVTNTEGNAMTGLSGATTIYYPDSSVFTIATLSELSNGEYYYNFTAPSTTGNYTATSAFTCGTNTDSNNAGRFSVTATPSPPPSSSGGGVIVVDGGGGGGGGGISGAIGAIESAIGVIEREIFSIVENQLQIIQFDKTAQHEVSEIQILPSESVKNAFVSVQAMPKPKEVAEVPKESKVFKYLLVSTSLKENQIEKVSVKFKVEKLWVALNEIEATSIALQQFENGEWKELTTILLGEDETAYYFQANAKHFSYFAITGLKRGSVQKELARIESIDLQEPRIGVQTFPIIEVFNNSSTELKFKLKVEIIQGIDVEFVSEELFEVKAKQVQKVEFGEKWIPIVAGTHVVSVKLYSPNKEITYDTKVVRIDINGDFRYDVIVKCPQSVQRGSALELGITIINAGDYYQDIGVSWIVTDPEEKSISSSSMPLALRPKEERILMQEVAIPSEALLGRYIAKAIVKYKGNEIIGNCAFIVRPVGEVFLKIEELPTLIMLIVGLLIAVLISLKIAKEFKKPKEARKEKITGKRFGMHGFLGFESIESVKKEKGREKGKGFSTFLGFKE